MRKSILLTNHFKVVCVVAILFTLITLFFPMDPVSDFEKYEISALDFSAYIKGGALPILYSPLLRLGIPPYLSALIINFSAFFLLASVFPAKKPLHSLLLLLIGIAWSAWAPIINADIPSVSVIIIGSLMLFKKQFFWGTFLLSVGLSMRLQTLVVAFILLLVLTLFNHRFLIPKIILTFLFVSLFFGLAIDMGMKYQSTEANEISKSWRDPIYAGFLATEPGKFCGEITDISKQEMLIERDLPIFSVVQFPEKPLQLVFCKWLKMIFYGASGSKWINNFQFSPLIIALILLETMSIYLLKIICVFLFILHRSRTPVYISTILIIVGYFLLHTFLEIQPRYMIPPLVFSLFLLCLQQPIHNFKLPFGKFRPIARTID